MNIILHIDPPKTGSTSIQSFLYTAQNELINDGILYPSTGHSEAGVTYQIELHERDAKSRKFTCKVYKTLNNIGKPIFNKPLYNKKDLRIYSTITEE